MNKRLQQQALKLKKKKRKKQCLFGVCVIALVLAGCFFSWWWQSAVFALCAYLLNEILWADHLFYETASDYVYNLSPDETHDVMLNNISLSGSYSSHTWFLPVTIKSHASGFWFDPYVVIDHDGKCEKQYFERGGKGLRYVNLSNFSEALIAGDSLTLKFIHCHATERQTTLLGFVHPDYSRKRLLIIAPHADDAEIAAFGLYSSASDVHIVTLTAGEVEMENYTHVYENPSQASRLKGRLRAMDGIVVPLWGGVPQDNCINLGYFCKQLPKMYQQPDQPVHSLTAGITDTRLFRQYNARTLQSDDNGLPTWNNLVQDLVELIDDIQPEVIITAQPDIDPHPDHIYGTKALLQALDKNGYNPEQILYYANHYRTVDMFPFGPEHTIASLPPQMSAVAGIKRICSFPLAMSQQKDKVFALEMMHDLKGKQKLKKRVRQQLLRLIGRAPNRYGQEGYFRKAIKSNELFYCGLSYRED